MAVEINWQKLKRAEEGNRLVFEHFCCQLFLRCFQEYGIPEAHYNMAGSEAYVTLQKSVVYNGVEFEAGDVIGIQAKFWLGDKDIEHSPIDISELEEGFDKTISNKPTIKLWIVGTPGKFTEGKWDELKGKLTQKKSDCHFIHWHKEIYHSFNLEGKKYNGIFLYYFDGLFVDESRLFETSNNTLTVLKNKFDVTLHAPTRLENILLSIVDRKKAGEILGSKIKQVVGAVRKDESQNTQMRERMIAADMPEEFIKLCEQEFAHIYALAERLKGYVTESSIENKAVEIDSLLTQYIAERKEIIDALSIQSKTLFDDVDSLKRNMAVRARLQEVIRRINSLENIIIGYPEGNYSLLQILHLLTHRVYSIFAEPGYGKTHFACSLTDNLLSRKEPVPVLFLQGTTFRKDEDIADILAKLLGMSSGTTIGDIMDVLDYVGEIRNCQLPIVIDGLHESAPKDSRWKSDILILQRYIQQHQHLMLVTTCRSQKDYLQTVYGCDSIEDIDNPYELWGIEPYLLEETAYKYFDRYGIVPNPNPDLSGFINPLLLKIFCKENEGKKNIDIHGSSLTECMQAYSTRMIGEIAGTGAGSENLKRRIEEELGNVAEALWERDVRQLKYIDEFLPLISEGNHADKLIDEGCCSLEKHDKETYVQFSYDMIAGYYIAKYIIDTHPDKEGFVNYIREQYPRLFGAGRHTFAQDIINNLLCLSAREYGAHLCMLMPTPEIISATFDNLDGLLHAEGGIETLNLLIANSSGDEAMQDKLCECIFIRLVRRKNIYGFRYFMPLFEGMKPMDFDKYWNNRIVEYPIMAEMYGLLHDVYVVERFQWDDVVCCNMMICGVIDKEFREKYHKLLFDHVLHHYDDINKSYIERGLRLGDSFIFESLLAVLTGIGLRSNEVNRAEDVISILEQYMQVYTSNSVFLLDALDTLYSYVENRWGVRHDKELLTKNKDEEWLTVDVKDEQMYDIYDYDEDKYNVKPLYQTSYYPIIKNAIDRDDVYGMLLFRCKKNGYDGEISRSLSKGAYDKASYRYNQQKTYGYKYGRQALSELYGWLMVNEQLIPYYKKTYRIEFMDIDPSNPYILEKWNFVTKSFMPDDVYNLEAWLKRNDLKEMEELFIRPLPKQEGEWVMLYGRIQQKIDDKYVDYYLTGHVEIDSAKDTNAKIVESEMTEPIDMGMVYAGELGWRTFEYREPEIDLDKWKRILGDYTFTSWSRNRFTYRGFKCLRTEVALELGLRFDVNTMTYYDKDGHVATMYYINDTDMFFYLRKDMVDTLLAQKKACLRLHIFENRTVSRELPEAIKAPKSLYKDSKADVIYRLGKSIK